MSSLKGLMNLDLNLYGSALAFGSCFLVLLGWCLQYFGNLAQQRHLVWKVLNKPRRGRDDLTRGVGGSDESGDSDSSSEKSGDIDGSNRDTIVSGPVGE